MHINIPVYNLCTKVPFWSDAQLQNTDASMPNAVVALLVFTTLLWNHAQGKTHMHMHVDLLLFLLFQNEMDVGDLSVIYHWRLRVSDRLN